MGMSLYSYVRCELTRGHGLKDGQGLFSEKQRRVTRFMKTPRELEKVRPDPHTPHTHPPHTHTHPRTHTHTHARTLTHPRTHTHTHPRTHTYTPPPHTHTHTPPTVDAVWISYNAGK